MKTIFETNRWICYIDTGAILNNGNGWKSWSIVLRKVCGNGDTGIRTATCLRSPDVK